MKKIVAVSTIYFLVLVVVVNIQAWNPRILPPPPNYWGGDCTINLHCRLGLKCGTSGKCECLFENLKYDTSIKKCVATFGQFCRRGLIPCVGNLICNENRKCECPPENRICNAHIEFNNFNNKDGRQEM